MLARLRAGKRAIAVAAVVGFGTVVAAATGHGAGAQAAPADRGPALEQSATPSPDGSFFAPSGRGFDLGPAAGQGPAVGSSRGS